MSNFSGFRAPAASYHIPAVTDNFGRRRRQFPQLTPDRPVDDHRRIGDLPSVASNPGLPVSKTATSKTRGRRIAGAHGPDRLVPRGPQKTSIGEEQN